jgi:hypothetical protein
VTASSPRPPRGRGGGHLLPSHGVSYDEVLSSFAVRADVPSTFSHQLEEKARRVLGAESEKYERERARELSRRRRATAEEEAHRRAEEEHRLWHTLPVHDGAGGYRIDEEASGERQILLRARVVDCVATLTQYAVITFAPCPDVVTFARQAKCRQGAVVVGALRAYQPWGEKSEMKGLAALYQWCAAWNPSCEPVGDDEESTTQAFYAGHAPKARKRAMQLLADAEIVLGAWVERWNRWNDLARKESTEVPTEKLVPDEHGDGEGGSGAAQ